MTKQELQEYYWVRRNIQRLKDKLLELETEATKQTTILNHAPKGGGYNKDKIAGLVAKIMEVQDEINGQLQGSYALLAKIEKAIRVLPQREGYLIRARYLDLKTWEQIAADMHYSWRWIHRIHSEALKLLD
ncbi:sigma factor-like helix-turn-helix DNA-binding protein [Desulfotomaculum sp. 1211_IL3151]|uniref:sigma factor-like helix-turn-helix DNA-binding protein n=1 Tax=Desulfotomaculum sp. 1211_IL3151 TaxID=3084055 RepID=UPI002FDB4B9D